MLYSEDQSQFSSTDITDEIVKNMLSKELNVTLNDLKIEFRIVLVLRYIEELSYREISKELGITEHVLGKRLERARKKLAELFTEKWGERYYY